MLFMVYNNCPGQQDPQISHQLNTYGTWWSGNLLFLQSLPQPLPNCDNRCKMLGTIYHRMTFSTFMTVCMQEYKPVLLPEGGTLSQCDCLSTPYCDMSVSSDLNLSYTLTMINYLSHQFTIQWTCLQEYCIFFSGSVCLWWILAGSIPVLNSQQSWVVLMNSSGARYAQALAC